MGRGCNGSVRAAAAAVAIAAAALLATGCYDRFDAAADAALDPDNANISIADLVAMYRDGTMIISENLVISGRVTSSDRAGNFYRSLMVEQEGTDGTAAAAVEIRASLTDMHNIWPVGSGIAVRLQGLALGESAGVKCLGLPPAAYSYNPVDYIPSRVELDRIISRTHGPEPFGIKSYRLGSLDRRMCGLLVRVVSLVPADDEAESRLWGGVNIFAESGDDEEEEDGRQRIAVTVSDYADFAAHAIPAEPVTVTGILQYGRPDGADEDMFILKPRDESDILY